MDSTNTVFIFCGSQASPQKIKTVFVESIPYYLGCSEAMPQNKKQYLSNSFSYHLGYLRKEISIREVGVYM